MNSIASKIFQKALTINDIIAQQGQLIIAGPCSAESQMQVMETAKALATDGRVHFLRAGAWKPRTMPGTFQGMGIEGLKWLRDASFETGLPVATEVGSERHVFEALKYGIDLLWIGARTVSNPFIIQEIAEAIRGIDIPVLVKNPLSPDIDLWEGAINRFVQVGVKQIGAIHRGFTWWGKSIFRNQPFWDIPKELNRRMAEIPLICDPSHIAGKRKLVPLIAHRSIDNGMQGLMVEVHPNPDDALSDASQQLTPNSFFAMLDNQLNEIVNPSSAYELLEELRSEVDIIDELVVWALANRMELSQKIAGVKKTSSMEVLQQGRWEEVINRVIQIAVTKGLSPIFIEKLFNEIHTESCLVQKKQKAKRVNKSTKLTTFIQ